MNTGNWSLTRRRGLKSRRHSKKPTQLLQMMKSKKLDKMLRMCCLYTSQGMVLPALKEFQIAPCRLSLWLPPPRSVRDTSPLSKRSRISSAPTLEATWRSWSSSTAAAMCPRATEKKSNIYPTNWSSMLQSLENLARCLVMSQYWPRVIWNISLRTLNALKNPILKLYMSSSRLKRLVVSRFLTNSTSPSAFTRTSKTFWPRSQISWRVKNED